MEKRPFDFFYKLLDRQFLNSEKFEFDVNPNSQVRDDEMGNAVYISFSQYLLDDCITEKNELLTFLDLKVLEFSSSDDEKHYLNAIMRAANYLIGEFNKRGHLKNLTEVRQIIEDIKNEIETKYFKSFDVTDEVEQHSTGINQHHPQLNWTGEMKALVSMFNRFTQFDGNLCYDNQYKVYFEARSENELIDFIHQNFLIDNNPIKRDQVTQYLNKTSKQAKRQKIDLLSFKDKKEDNSQ